MIPHYSRRFYLDVSSVTGHSVCTKHSALRPYSLGGWQKLHCLQTGGFYSSTPDRRYINSSLWKCDSVCFEIGLWPLFYGHDRMQAQRSDWVKAVLSSRARNLLHGGDTNRLGEHVQTRNSSKFRGPRPYTFVHFSIISVYYEVDDALCLTLLHVTTFQTRLLSDLCHTQITRQWISIDTRTEYLQQQNDSPWMQPQKTIHNWQKIELLQCDHSYYLMHFQPSCLHVHWGLVSLLLRALLFSKQQYTWLRQTFECKSVSLAQRAKALPQLSPSSLWVDGDRVLAVPSLASCTKETHAQCILGVCAVIIINYSSLWWSIYLPREYLYRCAQQFWSAYN